jgi:hypothetical protein
VASVTDQRKVDACPRSIEDGSAVNWATTGALAVSVVVVVVVLVGGGGGGVFAIGTFFLHPSANAISKTLINTAALFVLLNLNPPFQMSLSPNRHLVPALTGELLHMCPVGQHGKYLHLTAAPIG